jgi:hypothetical protein
VTFVFSLEPGLDLRGVLFLSQQFFDARECAECSSGARSDSFIGTVEIVPSQGLHVRPQDEIGVAFPHFKLVLLRCAHRAANHLKNVCWGAAVAVLHAHGDTDYRGSTEVASGVRWNRGDEPAVRKAPCADFDRFEQAREGATRADGVHKIALGENHGFAGGQVRGHHCKRNPEILKLARIENAFD